MTGELKPIRTKADYKRALAKVERLWGARTGTPEGDRLDGSISRRMRCTNGSGSQEFPF